MNIEEIGLRIASKRKQLEYTQQQLADILNVSDKAVSKWERGVGCPDVSLLIPLSEALHISVEELISGQKEVSEEQHKKTIQEIILYTKNVASKHSLQILRAIYCIVTIALYLASAIVLLVEYVMFNTFTWSFVAVSACIYSWVVISTLYFVKSNKIIKTAGVASVGVIGLLYSIAIIYFDQAWYINVAIPITICSGIYACIVAWIWMKTTMNIYYKLSWTIILSIPINVISNMSLETFKLQVVLNVATNLLITMVLFILGKRQERMNHNESNI